MKRLLGLLTGAALTAASFAAAAPGDPAGHLEVAAWEGSALARRVGGSVAVLAGRDGSLRWEIAQEPDTSLVSLLERAGRGWTVILAPDGAGTRNAWGQEWHPLESGLARFLAAATRAVLDGGNGDRRVVVPEAKTGLRARLAARGRGRGGPGEILHVVRGPAGDAVVTSTRRPGRLQLSPWRRIDVRYPLRESFVPLWPLAELLEFPSKSGNTGD